MKTESKTFMVLGAGIFQVPLIERIIELGHRCLAVSNRPDDPGLAIATEAVHLSTTSKNELVRIALVESVEKALTCASETAVPVVAAINQALGYKNQDIYALISDKLSLRQYLQEKGFSIPAFTTQSDEIEVETNEWMCKPRFGGGSRHVFKWRQASHKSRSQNDLFFERYMYGPEYGGDFLVNDGKICFLQLTNKQVNHHWVPYQHLLTIAPNKPETVFRYLQELVNLLGIKEGVFNFDLIDNNGNIFLIDLGARCGGNCIPELIELTYGFSVFDFLIGGLKNYLWLSAKASDWKFGVHILHATSSGKLLRYNLDVLHELQSQGSVERFFLRWQKGHEVKAFTEGAHHGGYIIFKARSVAELEKLASNIASTSWIELQ